MAIHVPDAAVTGTVVWRRFPTEDPWSRLPLERDGEVLRSAIPRQGMAGKVEYHVELAKNGTKVEVPPDEAAVARFIEQRLRGAGAPASAVERDAAHRAHFFLEPDINGWGYRFMQEDRPSEAAVIFRINVELFPDSWNCYDSLGEAYMVAGKLDKATKNYETAVAMNPVTCAGAPSSVT